MLDELCEIFNSKNCFGKKMQSPTQLTSQPASLRNLTHTSCCSLWHKLKHSIHPSRGKKETEKISKPYLKNNNTITISFCFPHPHRNTLVTACTFAPEVIKTDTHSSWPFFAAAINAVSPPFDVDKYFPIQSKFNRIFKRKSQSMKFRHSHIDLRINPSSSDNQSCQIILVTTSGCCH